MSPTAPTMPLGVEGFTYADSNNGFRGGLAGGALTSQLTVIVLDDYTGAPVPRAYVLAGDDLWGSEHEGAAAGDAPDPWAGATLAWHAMT